MVYKVCNPEESVMSRLDMSGSTVHYTVYIDVFFL